MNKPINVMSEEILNRLIVSKYVETDLNMLLKDKIVTTLVKINPSVEVDYIEVVSSKHSEDEGIITNYLARVKYVYYGEYPNIGKKAISTIELDRNNIIGCPVTTKTGRQLCEEIAKNIQIEIVNNLYKERML